MPKPKILLLDEICQAKDAWAALAPLADTVRPTATSRQEFLAEARAGAFAGCVAAYRAFASYAVTGQVDAEVVAALPDLRYLAHCGAGYDQVDVAACAERAPHPVRVSNVPGAVDDSTADTAVFLILGALRNFNTSILAARRGRWRGEPEAVRGFDPQGKTLGILGMGGIGRNLKLKMDVFGMRTIYHNRRPLGAEQAAGAEYVSFDELLATSDVLSLNLPLNKHTHHIISRAEFAKMKPGVTIVNTARGGVMDEAALVEALESGRVWSAGLDVYEDEPRIHQGLLDNPNVLLLPHMGTWSRETLDKMERVAIANVRSALEKGKLETPVPEHEGL